MIRNVISNALKFTLGGGRVSVRGYVKRKGNEASSGMLIQPPPLFRIEITDTGAGMTPVSTLCIYLILLEL